MTQKTKYIVFVLLMAGLVAAAIYLAAEGRVDKSQEPEETAIVTLSYVLLPECEAADPSGWREISCRVTAYCPCAKCCGRWSGGPTASGVMPKEGSTVAVDPEVIPLGSEVIIDDRIYIAEDTGVSGNAIDIFMGSHDAALRWGVKRVTVKWREAAWESQSV